ncbi:hypothetical protein [Thermaurantiacus sp.]
MRWQEGVAGLFGLLLGTAGAAAAAAQGAAVPLERLLSCARIDDEAKRLACFDAEVAERSAEAKRLQAERAAAARARAEAEAAAAAQAARAAEAERRLRFGGEALGGPAEARIESIEATITETFMDRSKLLVFVLDNGHVWRQTDGGFSQLLKPGTRVVVRRGRLGGYMLEIAGRNRLVPVRRIR